ncbi:MAG: cytidine deaminase [Prevotella sp.]|nr:cytidine deaminase [Prevotella sp.]
MEELVLKSTIQVVRMEELAEQEQALIDSAIAATNHSYAVYSRFQVGAAVLLTNGKTILGCNQENVSYPAGICAERSAIYAAGAQYPDTPIETLAIAARNTEGNLLEEPISPCGICRQVIVETETRFHRPIRILLYGTKYVYIIQGIKALMPLSFKEF